MIAGDRAVNSFKCEINFSLNFFLKAKIKENRLKFFGVFEAGIFVKSNNYGVASIQQAGFLIKNKKAVQYNYVIIKYCKNL